MKYFKILLLTLIVFFSGFSLVKADVYTLNYLVATKDSNSSGTIDYSGVVGKISGANPQYMNSLGIMGTEVTAIAGPGYTFSQWSDGKMTPTRSDAITNPSGNNYTAYFTKSPIYLKYSADEGGSVSGYKNQVIGPNLSASSVEAIPNSGYIFVGWSDKTSWARGGRTIDNCTILDTERTDYTKSDINAIAKFAKISAKITPTFNNTSCSIPDGKSYCTIGVNWNINPPITSGKHQIISGSDAGAIFYSGYYEDNDTTKPYHYFDTDGYYKDNNGKDFGIPIYYGSGSVCIFDNELGVAPIGLAITKINVNGKCANSLWDPITKKCEQSGLDLTISKPIKINPKIGEYIDLTATVSNIGGVDINDTFRNTFQIAGDYFYPFSVYVEPFKDNLKMEYISPNILSISSLAANKTKIISAPYRFTGNEGTYFIRSCTDSLGTPFAKAPERGYDIINESNENNNCSEWVEVRVSKPDCGLGTWNDITKKCDSTSEASGNLSVSPSFCKIKKGESTCGTYLSWSTSNLIVGRDTAVTSDNPSHTTVSTLTSANNFFHKVNYGVTKFYLYHDAVQLAPSGISEVIVNASCEDGSNWNNTTKQCEEVISGSLDGKDCKIMKGQNSCSTSLTLSIDNPISGAGTNITKPINVEIAKGINPLTKTGIMVDYPSTTFYLNHNSQTIAFKEIKASCQIGTDWDFDKKICVENNLLSEDDLSMSVKLFSDNKEIKLTPDVSSSKKLNASEKINYNSKAKILWQSVSNSCSCVYTDSISGEEKNCPGEFAENSNGEYITTPVKRDTTYKISCFKDDNFDYRYIKIISSKIAPGYIEI